MWHREIMYLKMMLQIELETVLILTKNRYNGLLAQDHVQNMISLVEVQQNIVRVKGTFALSSDDRFDIINQQRHLDGTREIGPAFGSPKHGSEAAFGLQKFDMIPKDLSEIEPQLIRKNALQKYYTEIMKTNKVWLWINELYDKQKYLTILYFKHFFDNQRQMELQTKRITSRIGSFKDLGYEGKEYQKL